MVLSGEEREVLDDLIRSKLTSVYLALRARIVLLAARGLQNKEIALALDVRCIQASRWRERYRESGLEGMAPPEHALVLCCDEKRQVQALGRTQPGPPMKKERAATMTHDYKRNGTTTRLAALNVLDVRVIGPCQPRHTHSEWLKFLRQIDRETPKS